PAPSRQAMAASTAPVVRTYLGDVMPVGRASRRPGSPRPGHRLLTSVSHGGRQVRVFGGPAGRRGPGSLRAGGGGDGAGPGPEGQGHGREDQHGQQGGADQGGGTGRGEQVEGQPEIGHYDREGERGGLQQPGGQRRAGAGTAAPGRPGPPRWPVPAVGPGPAPTAD